MRIGPVNVCTVHICTCVFACEIECKLVVCCRPRCRLMVYRQVIYDLSVAGSKEGDTRLSQQINKRCSGASITSPLHVCERTDSAPALFCLLKQPVAFCWSSHFLSFRFHTFQCFFLFCYHPYFNAMYPPPLFCPVPLLALIVFVLPFLTAGSSGLWHASHHLQEYGVKLISYRTLLQQYFWEGGLQINFKVFLGVTHDLFKTGRTY